MADCGCRVEHEVDERKMYVHKIVYCSLHAAAEKLRDALERSTRQTHDTYHVVFGTFEECVHTACAAARAVLVESGGK